jgi:hypothetical protein
MPATRKFPDADPSKCHEPSLASLGLVTCHPPATFDARRSASTAASGSVAAFRASVALTMRCSLIFQYGSIRSTTGRPVKEIGDPSGNFRRSTVVFGDDVEVANP